MLAVRKFQLGDELALRALFYNTIRTINTKDYSLAQVQAWAPKDYDQAEWLERMQSIEPFVAVFENTVVGYADVQADGYIDHFFCHADYQGKGIGKLLMATLDKQAKHLKCERLYAHASITAKPFFEHFGFTLVKEQLVDIRGQQLKNFVMEKSL